jgi:cell division septal protein FtsQ
VTTKRIGAKTRRIMLERKKNRGKLLNYMFIFACICAGLTFAYYAVYPEIEQKVKEYAAINSYHISGMENLDSAEIIACIGIDETSSFFNVSTHSIEKLIEKIDGIEKVKVSKTPLSNTLEIKITQRAPNYLVNVGNELYWADANGILWQNPKLGTNGDFCLVVGLKFDKNSENTSQKKIVKSDLEMLEKTYSVIRGKGKNANNIKTIAFKENNIVEFASNDISVPIRLNATLKYGTDELVKFENILRKDGKSPSFYMDVYENAIFAK